MRREGYELQVAQPEVIFHQDEDGRRLEPFERVEIEVAEEHQGVVVEEMGKISNLSFHSEEKGGAACCPPLCARRRL